MGRSPGTKGVDIDFVEVGNVIAAKATLSETFHGEGEAKCSPEDEFDRSIGRQLAAGRALRQLGQKLQNRGWEKVRRSDELKKEEKQRQIQFDHIPVVVTVELPHVAQEDLEWFQEQVLIFRKQLVGRLMEVGVPLIASLDPRVRDIVKAGRR